MKPKKFKAQVKRVQAILDKWLGPLGLNWFRIEVLYFDRGKQFPRKSLSVANVTADWRYMSAQISFNIPLIAHLDDDELERCIVHELVHVLLEEIQHSPDDLAHVERVTTWLTKAFLWVRGWEKDHEQTSA